MRISDWSSDVCSSDLEDDAFDAHASIVAGGNRQRIDSRARAQRVEQGGLHGKAALAVARQVPERNAERYRQQKEGRSKDAQLPQRLTRTVLTAEPIARSEEHTSELQSLMRISYAVFCLKKKRKNTKKQHKHE